MRDQNKLDCVSKTCCAWVSSMMQEKEEEPRDGYNVIIVEYNTCFMAFVDHLNATGFILKSLSDVAKHWKMGQKPLVALFHDRINVLTEQKSVDPRIDELKLVTSLKLSEIFQPGTALGCRLLKTRVDDYCKPEKEFYRIKITALGDTVITDANMITLSEQVLIAIECQQGYNVYFNL